MPPLWTVELAEEFRRRAGGSDSVSHDLRGAIVRTLPVTVVDLPRLRVDTVDRWLARQSIPCDLAAPDRPLRACVIARYGSGAIFVDDTDPDDEYRFSLAHELAHFLRHYRHPRRRAIERVGTGVLEVLDGDRPAALGERIDSLVTHVPVGAYIHLMDRGGRRVDDAEREADLLACELLAPMDEVLHETAGGDLVAVLVGRYGLPPAVAGRYAASLTPAPRRSAAERLGLV
ncbi:MAG TPA: ImmA/IrrE family metallo-endopeptidase [Chloroflexota bacterium]|nr:ImmA/IrrE family metallo-endopeptidase [Chloroflexota bacterium]